jgi:hypothetical protein
MDTRLVHQAGKTYLEVIPSEWRVASERHALDLVAACGENGTNRLLLHAASLSEDFYQLKTGLAGDVLQKFANYRIRSAAIIPLELASQGRFGEMVWEANRGNQFRVFQDLRLAEQWLVSS